MCVCTCMRERGREKEIERGKERKRKRERTICIRCPSRLEEASRCSLTGVTGSYELLSHLSGSNI